MNSLKLQDVFKVVMAVGLNTIHNVFNYLLNRVDEWAEKTSKEPILDSSEKVSIRSSVIENPLTCPIDEYTENEYLKQLSNPYPRN